MLPRALWSRGKGDDGDVPDSVSRATVYSCLGVALLSAVFLVTVQIVDVPLSVDGGWYSYPSFAASQGRDPYSYQLPLEEARKLPGLKALFSFETTSSLRTAYAIPWFSVFGGKEIGIRLLSLLELVLVVALCCLLYASGAGRWQIPVLLTALLLTDKAFLLSAANDFRPDLALAGMGVALYLVLRMSRGSAKRIVLACVVAAGLALTSPVAAVPLAVVFAAIGTDALLLESVDRRRRLIEVALVGAVAAIALVGRNAFFLSLFNTQINVVDPVDSSARIASLLSNGFAAVAGKELGRYKEYFLISNAHLLLAIGLWVVLLVRPRKDTPHVVRHLLGLFIGLGGGMLVLAFLDPHGTADHLIPLMPFVLLVGGRVQATRGRLAETLLAVVVSIGAVGSIAVAGKGVMEARRTGTNNAWLRRALAGLVQEPRSYLMIGPTELWPYFPKNRDILILDVTRSAATLSTQAIPWNEVDYVLLNGDYAVDEWTQALGRITGRTIIPAVERQPRLTVMDLRHRPAGPQDATP